MAQRATSLGPKPSFFFVCLFLLCLVFLSFLIGKPCFPPKKGNFCLFICVSLCFSLALFGPPPFSLSLSLSLSLFFFFLVSFLFSFLFLVLALSFCFVSFSRCYFVLVFFSACCLALFWIIMFDFLLLCILFSYSCCFWFLLLSYFVFLFNYLSKNISEKFGNCKKQKMKNAQKKDILTRAVSTGMLTNSVFFFFSVFL